MKLLPCMADRADRRRECLTELGRRSTWIYRSSFRFLNCFIYFALGVGPKFNLLTVSLFYAVTSSVSYCAPPELVLVQQFDVTYIAANASVFFNISAASVEKNVNVSANLLLNVYGMQPLNLTIDLCDLLNGLLCPLPTYNFVGSTTIPVPSSVNVANHVPGIAYKIPDLEAFAQLTLTSVDTGEVKACVQSTLSNGWSTRQAGVQWATGGLAFFSLLSALWHSIESPEALAPFRFIDMMSLFQTIAVSALLNLNYPVVYRSFASNFAWSLGLFSASATSKVQDAINNLRHLTGGTMPDANGGSAIDLVNRKLSPYNVNQRNTLDSLQGVVTSFMDNLKTAGNSNHLGKRDVALVTSESSNILQAGIPVFVNSLGISTANAFMSVFFTLLMLAAITLAVLLFGWAILILVLKRREKKACLPGQVEDWKLYYPWFSKAWAIRLVSSSFRLSTAFQLLIVILGSYLFSSCIDICVQPMDSEGFMACHAFLCHYISCYSQRHLVPDLSYHLPRPTQPSMDTL